MLPFQLKISNVYKGTTKLSIMTLSITRLSIMTLSIAIKIQHSALMRVSISIIEFLYCNAECHYAERLYVGCHYAECHYSGNR